MKSQLPSLERLSELLSYDRETGGIVWRSTRGSRASSGAVAGSINKAGYRVIRVDGVLHYGHRLAWLMAYGEAPRGEIDHRDGCKSNNAIHNLREVCCSVNMQNLRTATKRNRTTGLLGASRDKRDGRYVARITVGSRHLFLGRFNSPEEAHRAYIDAKRLRHEGCTI